MHAGPVIVTLSLPASENKQIVPKFFEIVARNEKSHQKTQLEGLYL
jgi:hypothetical protein